MVVAGWVKEHQNSRLVGRGWGLFIHTFNNSMFRSVRAPTTFHKNTLTDMIKSRNRGPILTT